MALPGDVAKIKDLPTIFVVFGATGDLSRKKIFPSFFELFKNKLLPEKFKIIAYPKVNDMQFSDKELKLKITSN